MPGTLPLERVSVIGTSCSGKTTFARRLSAALGAPHVELDELHWEPEWTPVPAEEFRARVRAAAAGARWVFDGNYSAVRPIVWERATTVVWLNYGFARTFGRALRRTVRRCVRREELFSGNYETFRRSFLSSESILLWVASTWRRRWRVYPGLLEEQSEKSAVLELHTPRDAEDFLRSIEAGATSPR